MGNAVVRWNIMLSFSPFLAKSSRAESVFWPGCSALKLDGEILQKTLEILRAQLPGLGFSTWCCGKPAFAAGGKKAAEKRRRQLAAYFAKQNIQTIYTLCPNCQKTLAEVFSGRVLPAWPLLAAHAVANPQAQTPFAQTYILHDPCAARRDEASQTAAREILAARGLTFTEFAHCRKNTRCCGRKDMLFLKDPPRAKQMLDSRLNEADGQPIVSYCESCVEAFLPEGAGALHLLEALLGQKSRRRFINRFYNANRGSY